MANGFRQRPHLGRGDSRLENRLQDDHSRDPGRMPDRRRGAVPGIPLGVDHHRAACDMLEDGPVRSPVADAGSARRSHNSPGRRTGRVDVLKRRFGPRLMPTPAGDRWSGLRAGPDGRSAENSARPGFPVQLRHTSGRTMPPGGASSAGKARPGRWRFECNASQETSRPSMTSSPIRSTGITRFRRYYGPLRHPRGPACPSRAAG